MVQDILAILYSTTWVSYGALYQDASDAMPDRQGMLSDQATSWQPVIYQCDNINGDDHKACICQCTFTLGERKQQQVTMLISSNLNCYH